MCSATLMGASFQDSILTKANFQDCAGRDVIFSGALLEDCNWEGAVFDHALEQAESLELSN